MSVKSDRLKSGVQKALAAQSITLDDGVLDIAVNAFPAESMSIADIDGAVAFFNLELSKAQVSGKNPADALKGATIASINAMQEAMVANGGFQRAFDQGASAMGFTEVEKALLVDIARMAIKDKARIEAFVKSLSKSDREQLFAKHKDAIKEFVGDQEAGWFSKMVAWSGRMAQKTAETTVMLAPLVALLGFAAYVQQQAELKTIEGLPAPAAAQTGELAMARGVGVVSALPPISSPAEAIRAIFGG
jgi:hypothetical protein